MEINRNQYFLIGMVLFLLGLQLRLVDTYHLNAATTQYLAERSTGAESESQFRLAAMQMTGARKVVEPPDWIGWLLLSSGAVLILHSFALRRPD